MAAIAERHSDYRREFEADSAQRAGWLAPLQQRGIEAFESQGFPTRRQEAWRKVDLTPVTKQHYPRVAEPGRVSAALTDKLGAFAGHRVVFVDGIYAPELSDIGSLPKGLTVGSLAEYGDSAPERLTRMMGQRVDIDAQPFIALNTGLFRDGAFVHVARGALIEQPVVIVHLATEAAQGHAVYPRTVTQVEDGAEARVIEQFVSPDEVEGLVVPVSEVHAGQDAIVDYHRLQEEGAAMRHIGGVHASAERNAGCRVYSLASGASLSRVDYYADLEGEGVDMQLNGLYLTEGRQFADQHTYVNHRIAHGTSSQIFRGIVQGRSETTFDGLIRVFEGAEKTSAEQQNRNLLLDKLALSHSNPRLEIFNNDVVCTHGSTVGELDEMAMFYLQSRGISEAEATSLLTVAFANEVLANMRDERVSNYIRDRILDRLPGGENMRSSA